VKYINCAQFLYIGLNYTQELLAEIINFYTLCVK